MRKLIALLTIFSFNVYAAPPTGIGGEQGTLSYTNNLKAPNYQITSLGGVNSRIESGNTNLLINPSFEHPTVGTGWTTANATASADITNQVDGKKALSLSVTGAMLVSQDSTVNAANISGLQGVASIKIKATGTTGLKVCPRTAGAAVSGLCVNVTADNTWKHVSIPFILGITSNGIGIATTATGGTVIVDDAFVGTSAPFQDVSGAKLVGACTTTLGSDQTSASATFATLSAASSISVVTYGSGTAPSTNTTGCKFASIPAGDYLIIWDGEFGNSTTGQRSIFSVSDGTNQSTDEDGVVASSGFGANSMTARISYSTAQSNVTFVPVAKSAAGSAIIRSNTKQTFKLFYYPPASKIYSQASQDYDWTSYTPTSPNSSLTLSATSCYHKRKGSDLYVRCNLTHSAVAASEAQISLPNSLVISSNTPSITNAACGRVSRSGFDSSTYHSSLLCTGGQSYFRFGTRNNTATDLTARLANAVFVAGESMYFESGPIPISGWSDYGVIVGSFAGIEKCANDYECTDTFSAKVSASGVVSNENIDWINGNCTAGTTTTCTINTNIKDGTSAITSPLNCSVVNDVAGNSGRFFLGGMGVSLTTISVQEVTGSSNTVVSLLDSFTLKCQKGSQDYKAKTGKVATTTGVSYVPGAGAGELYDSFSFAYGGATISTACSASPCTLYNKIGNSPTTMTWASTGNMTLNLNKTYSILNCMVVVGGTSSAATGGLKNTVASCSSCNSLNIPTGDYNSIQNTFGNIMCQGKY
jgi:hypothetical protein